MELDVDCDTCDFGETVDEEWRAYDRAKVHESEHPTHTVLVRRLE